ncbi:MAG: 23S rRNA (uracil(1939)-C(5))-methyltransferase RlmD [Candidatus Woesearchaeota archaeon]
MLVERMDKKGAGLANIGKRHLAVQGAHPGDEVEGTVTKTRRGPILTSITWTKRAERVEPFCPHFGECGGCVFQDMPYEKQLIEKRQLVQDNFPGISVHEVIPSPTQHYRNRMDFAFFPGGIGMHKRGAWHSYVDLNECEIFSTKAKIILQIIKKWQESNSLSSYDVKTQKGLLRYAVVRESKANNTVLLTITTTETIDDKLLLELWEKIKNNVTSLYTSIQDKQADLSIGELRHVIGETHIKEELLGEEFSIGPGSFFQTNTVQAEKLFNRLREIVDEIKPEIVWDLYAGVGTIARLINAKSIHCVEEDKEAVRIGKETCPENVTFYEGSVENELIVLPDPGLIIVDPPRSGMHPKVRAFLKKVKAPILYVSCNPTTLASDCNDLDRKIERIELFDLFPHTMHVECIAVLGMPTVTPQK